MNDKVMSLQEAVSRFVHDGDMIAFGGFSTNRRPYGLVREIIRQGKKDLYIESGAAGGDVDLLIGAGLVKAINISYIANSGFTMVSRRFREAIEKGELPAEDYSLDVQTIAYHGAALGLPYVPVKNMLGSDLVHKWGISEAQREKFPKLPRKKFVIMEDPFEEGSLLCLVPTPKIDVALIHVQKASPDGICIIEGAGFQDVDIAMAAKHTLVTCEELVSDEQMRSHPQSNTLPGLCIDAVIPLSYGAHPSQCFGYYDYDPQAMIAYDKASRTQESFDAFAEEYLLIPHEEYLLKIGREHLRSLAVDKEAGYAKGLKRKG